MAIGWTAYGSFSCQLSKDRHTEKSCGADTFLNWLKKRRWRRWRRCLPENYRHQPRRLRRLHHLFSVALIKCQFFSLSHLSRWSDKKRHIDRTVSRHPQHRRPWRVWLSGFCGGVAGISQALTKKGKPVKLGYGRHLWWTLAEGKSIWKEKFINPI